ncbi:hypothetical protein M407DRAFT_230435 [Tulasnella calospora MUT 4182]|uniref:Uncharacterized protein n=1 Tax=Tulasnella calospora MUT 4182 TaxID=1051891 RepID=A0A0C3M485_9AGAM|nr:hypothetical protein M407DRAFT_230435 [Tulasnella calospora MUT 4182]
MEFGTPFASRQRGSEELHFAAIKRIISKSDDSIAFLHAVASIFTIRDRHLLAQFMIGDELRDRLLTLGGDIILRLQGSDHAEAAVAGARLLDAALAHITLSIPDDFEAELAFLWWWKLSAIGDRAARFPFNSSLHTLSISSASQNLLEAYLAYAITLREVGFGEETWLGTIVLYYLEGWASPSWKTISLMAIAIASLSDNDGHITILQRLGIQQDIRGDHRSKLRAAYVGADAKSALASIEFAFLKTENARETFPNRDCQDPIFIRVFNSAHRAAFDGKGELIVEAEDVSKLMELTERYLQTLMGPGINSSVGMQLLMNMLKIFQDTSMRLVACKSAPVSLLNHLVSIFNGLAKRSSKMGLGENDLEVLHVFGPIVQELFLLPDSGWWSHSGSYLTRSTPLDLDNDREGLRQAYDTFKLHVDRVSYTIKV